MAEPKANPDWAVVDQFVPGVTEEMIGWWWVNMEKGYELWEPDEHKSFIWEVPPPLNGHVGAIQRVKESIDYGPVADLRIEWVDPNIGTKEIKDWLIYKNVLCATGGPATIKILPRTIVLTHQWETVPGGCKMRSTSHYVGAPPVLAPPSTEAHPSGKKPTGGRWKAHCKSEGSRMSLFLPALWGIWQSVTDPAINRKSNYVLKRDGSRLYYG
jgi:hypothetical protein